MQPDDRVCLCHRVSLRKLSNYLQRESPKVPSQLSECLGAGTGCGWCIPFLRSLHEQWSDGKQPHLDVAPEEYAKRRKQFHVTGERDKEAERGR